LKLRWWMALLGLVVVIAGPLRAQDTDGPMSEAEIEQLREMAPVPLERMRIFQTILDARVKMIEDLLAKPKRVGFALDIHDAMDQFAQIVDEFNDNLDEFGRQHRDVRKGLPKLLRDAERWATVLRSPPENEGYSIVRKIALDDLGDLREIAGQMQVDEEKYFKEHPEAAKAEKNRLDPKQ
jgi:hypothetical protein